MGLFLIPSSRLSFKWWFLMRPASVGVMQATMTGGNKIDKRYSPSFRDDTGRKSSASKRKREDVLRLVSNEQLINRCILGQLKKGRTVTPN